MLNQRSQSYSKPHSLRAQFLRPERSGWMRLLAILLVLTTTAANASAVGFLHLCPVRGTSQADECCCEAEAPSVETASPAELGCCGKKTQSSKDLACGEVNASPTKELSCREMKAPAATQLSCDEKTTPLVETQSCAMGSNSTISKSNTCVCGQLVLTDDTVVGMILVVSEIQAGAVACLAAPTPWLAPPLLSEDRQEPKRSPPDVAATPPIYLLLSTWLC